MENCVFCHIENQKEKEIIAKNEFALAFYDSFPVSRGHVLIIPKRHVASFFELSQEEYKAIIELLNQCKKMLDLKYNPDGYNVGVNIGEAAGQSVFHVHMHLIPRYKGDVETPRGGVRGVIPSKQLY